MDTTRSRCARLAGLVWVLSAGAWGQGMLIPDRIVGHPEPLPPHSWPLPTAAQRVNVEVREFAATVTAETSFVNQYQNRIEGTFLFPLPENAAITDFAMTVNGQQVGAELLPADKARNVYESIVRRQRDPGLLEYLGRNAFRARIFPIEPGEVKKVKLEYTQPIGAEEGLAKLVFPLKVRAGQHTMPPPPRPWPRPMPMLERDGAVRDPARPISEDLPPPGTIGEFVITVRLESKVGIKSVYSPTHDIDVKRDGDYLVKASYEAKKVSPRDDFILYYQLSDKMFGLNMLSYRGPDDERGTFMLLLAPKTEVREQEIAAKDIVFVVDTSGSMSGKKIEQTRAALRYCLRNLKPDDRFNVLSFSTGVEPYETKLVAASADEVRKAVDFVDKLGARGGTNISEALTTALDRLPRDKARPAMILFLTDGEPTVGETRVSRILEGVERDNKANARVFVFGVGDDVNTQLLDKLSNDNHGTRTYVRPEENIETSVSSLYNKIASPVLSDLRLDVDGVKIEDVHPSRLPDLFRGSQLTVLGRYRGDGPARITLRGSAAGKDQVFTYSVDFPQRERASNFLPRLWATRRVGFLLEQIRLNGESKELVAEVTDLATRYGILTPYTSFLVLEPGMRSELGDRFAAGRDGKDGVPGMPGLAGRPGTEGRNGRDGRGAGGGPMAAPAPTTPTGGAAVARSKADAELKEADKPMAAKPGERIEHAGGKTFYLTEGVWLDSLWPKDTTKATIIKVKYVSDAWFDLPGLRAELKEILALGEKVKVKLGDVLLVIGDEGLEKLTDAVRKQIKG